MNFKVTTIVTKPFIFINDDGHASDVTIYVTKLFMQVFITLALTFGDLKPQRVWQYSDQCRLLFLTC